MIKDEFKFIRHNKLIMISVMVIMFIPFLYAIFFLKSVWDPYGDTKELPVAVVNNDVPVTYEGRTLDVGDQTVKKLRKNDQLGWKFVSADKAKEGLKHNKYYTVVTIPKNFSANAATVLEAHPKKMHLKYETNDSLNYLSQVISGVAMDKLDKQIRANVTNAYASTVFDQIKTMGKGMTKAAKGATQLSDGMVTLDDGVSKYTVGVSQVHDGLQTLKVSVAPLTSGVNQLADGGNQLQAGVSPLASGAQQLVAGASQLKAGTATLASGTQQLADGSNKLKAGTSELNAKTGTLKSGVGQLSTGADSLASGVTDYTDGTTTLAAGLQKLQAGNQAIVTQGIDPLITGAAKLDDGAGKYVAGVNGALKQLNDGATKLDYDQNFTKLEGAISTIQETAAQTSASAEADSAAIKKDMTTLTMNAIKSGDSETLKTLNDLSQHLTKLQTTQAQSTAGLNAALTQMATGIGALKAGSNNLVAGISNANSQLTAAGTQVQQGASQLAAGTKQLKTSYQQLSSGIDTAAQGSQQLTANNQQLNAGAGQLAAGMTTLNGQVPALTAGVAQLDQGAGQLNGGLTQLNQNVPALDSGAGQLANGLNQLNGKVPALVAGVTQLSAGLNELNSKTPALAAGVTKLADGSDQLNAKSGDLKSGANKLKDGNKTLATQLGDGAKTVNGIKLTSSTAKMFSAPTKMTQKHYSTVTNYGHALAPYVLSLALYVGALVFNFAYPIRKVSHEDGTPTQWFFSKITVGGLVAIGMAVIEASLIMVGGLTVDHVGMFYGFAILFSLTSMYFIMMLSMAFDNPGRFVAMIMLMLQLGGAGGTFPLQITNHFYNVIHPFLPMSYSVLGFRQALTGGIYSGTIANSVGFLIGFTILSLILLWIAMIVLQKLHLMGVSQLDDNQKLQEVEK